MANEPAYIKRPIIPISSYDACIWSGYKQISVALRQALEQGTGTVRVLVIECYPGVDKEEILRGICDLNPSLVIDSDRCAYSGPALDRMLAPDLTDDRVFGIMTTKGLEDYFRPESIEQARQKIANSTGLSIVIGIGASLIAQGDLLVYCDLARWEIQLRYRAGMSNWNTDNGDAPILSKYKRGYFVEWRLADKLKKRLLMSIDFLLDSNRRECPVMVTGEAFRQGLSQIAKRPFRLCPYFDPGVWGGQWMKEKLGLDSAQENYAWSFDGVPEENSLLMQFGETVLEVPAVDLVFWEPRRLLGERVHARFGKEFPIRFDLLDTMGGQNLSLQVHPLTEYIQETFNMRYTQDESYYLLDAAENASVYLGLKKEVNREAMLCDLHRAEQGESSFPADQYINRIPIKKHDHVLIPAGTIHCSGAGAMVLEISATPYIFTFKLWDWDRVGLDGLPRPVHLAHGAANIQWDYDTDWVMKNLVGQTQLLHCEDGVRVERTGLHQREFIETTRYAFSKPVQCESGDSVHMLNLVEGDEVVVTSPDNAFDPFTVHYAETFIIPACVGSYVLAPAGLSEGREVMVIQASVRG